MGEVAVKFYRHPSFAPIVFFSIYAPAAIAAFNPESEMFVSTAIATIGSLIGLILTLVAYLHMKAIRTVEKEVAEAQAKIAEIDKDMRRQERLILSNYHSKADMSDLIGSAMQPIHASLNHIQADLAYLRKKVDN